MIDEADTEFFIVYIFSIIICDMIKKYNILSVIKRTFNININIPLPLNYLMNYKTEEN